MYDIKNVKHVESQLDDVVSCMRAVGVEATYHLGVDNYYEVVCKYKGNAFGCKMTIRGTGLSIWAAVDSDLCCILAYLLGVKFSIDRRESSATEEDK